MQLGIKNLHFARVVKDGDIRTYETPFKAAESIKIDLSVEIAEATLYSHDELIFSEKDFKKGKIVINTADLDPEVIRQLLGYEMDDDGVIYAGKEDEENKPVFAVGFSSQKADGKTKYIWLLETTFNTPSESYETMKDGITIITPTIEGEFVKTPDDTWKADYVGKQTDIIASGWFNEVRMFVTTETEFTVRLNNLNGLIVTGVWNAVAGKLTC